jgi:transcriptional regulator with XRE-family HTH domain
MKRELKASGMTYAALAIKLGMAESSVKRMLAANTKGDLSLSKVDAICRALKIDFAELARRVADSQPLITELTLEQERSLVGHQKLMLVAICVLSLWTLEQMTTQYRMSAAECTGLLARLDRIGIIELRPMNRYTLKLAKTFKWRPHGPVMQFFREHAVQDFFREALMPPVKACCSFMGKSARRTRQSFWSVCSGWRKILRISIWQIKN